MNSTNNDDAKENLPATNSDNNANLNLDESKGAIPKRKILKICSKKTNNNIDEIYNKDTCKENGCSTRSDNLHSTLEAWRSADSKNKCEECSDSPFNNLIDSGDNLSDNTEPCSSSDQKNDYKKDSDSLSDENELLSVSDDGCIYTYKGDYAADLPSSFFNLELIPAIDNEEEKRQEDNQSPEMDFLEMDFDPGVSGDVDSNSESEHAENDDLPLDSTQEPPIPDQQPCCSYSTSPPPPKPSAPPTILSPTKIEVVPKPTIIQKVEIQTPWSCTMSERTRTGKSLRVIKKHHSPKGELSSPSSVPCDAISSETYTPTGDSSQHMVWTQQEAQLNQITQIAPSACGATAVINVLNALRIPIPSLEVVQQSVNTRLRANSSPLADYLISRSRAGCNHRDIILGLDRLSNQELYARFFAMYPERIVNLQQWLGFWIQNGAIPIATINLQKCDGPIPDSWHHQMIYGVDANGIYMTNPLEYVDPQQLWPQLSSESVLLIRKEDVVSRWTPQIDFNKLATYGDRRWHEINVLGQVAHVIRESRRKPRADCVFTSHIKIPADYKAGITLVLKNNSPAVNLLRQSPELPLLHPDKCFS